MLPAYNEADKIPGTVEKVSEALQAIANSFEIIIAEDGSTDGTAELSAQIAAEHTYVGHMHSDERLGRGKALKRAFKQASGNILVYMDLDLATDLRHLKEIVDAIRSEHDIAIGSRLMPESKIERSPKREFLSRGYNLMVRLFLRSKLRDHQCGFKAFRWEKLMEIIDDVQDNHWFWDTELLVRAQRKKMRVKEIPVRWHEAEDTKVKASSDAFEMGSKVLSLWWKLWRE